MKVALNGVRRRTRGRKSSGGDRAGRGLNHRVSRRTGERSKALKAGASCWDGGKPSDGGERNDTRAAAGDELAALLTRDKPLKSEPWTWLRGETNPRSRQRSNPSRTCETSRAERRGLGMPAPGGLCRWRRDEGCKPMEGSPDISAGPVWLERLCRTGEAHERMKLDVQTAGGRRRQEDRAGDPVTR